MLNNDFYSAAEHGEFETFDLGDFSLERGGSLPNCKLTYATHGELNADKSNAVLFPHMFSGTSGSLKHYVGDGLPLDPAKYFVVFPNQLGGGLSSSPHNTPAPHGMSAFPALDIADDVRAQHRLLREQFGIEELQLVLGWSMGAQQTYEWAVRYPDMVKRAAPIAGTARVTPHDAMFVEAFCAALKSDPAWAGGDYAEPHAVETGLRRMARLFALLGASSEFYKQEAWKRAGFESLEAFQTNFWEGWFLRMDPNALLSMADKWHNGDVAAPHNGDLQAALGRVSAKVCVIAFAEDMFVPARDCRAEQEMIKGSTLCELDTLWGHFGMFGLFEEDFKAINGALAKLLAS